MGSSEKPFVVYMDPIHDFVFRKWKFDGKLIPGNLKIFLKNVWDGHKEPFYASEEAPDLNDEPLKVPKIV